MKDLKFILGCATFLFGILFGAGEMESASFLEFLLMKILAFAIIIAGNCLIKSAMKGE